MANDTKIFGKVYTYTFSEEQLKRILMDLLLLSGENIPVDVHDQLDPEQFCQYESDVEIKCESTEEINTEFNITLTYTDAELAIFIKNYEEQLADKNSDSEMPVGETAEDLPDNVWTQETSTPCGKE